MTAEKRPYAVFDIDGTLIRWQLYHAIVNYFVKTGLIEQTSYNHVLEFRNRWKGRSSPNAFNDYEQSLVHLIDRELKGLDYAIFNQACEAVFNRYKDQTYVYTKNLIYDLKKKGYLLFAISASPQEIIKLISKYYQFDDFSASTYEVVNHHLTGQKKVLLGQEKALSLSHMILKYNAKTKNSIAVGDSSGDILMLNMTTQPIAFNPSRELYNSAIKNHWKVVIERKNVIYHLEYKHGQYILASTNYFQETI